MTKHITMTQDLKDYLVENTHSLLNIVKLADTTGKYVSDAKRLDQVANLLDIHNVSMKDAEAIYDICEKWYGDHSIDEDFDSFWTAVYNIYGISEDLLGEF